MTRDTDLSNRMAALEAEVASLAAERQILRTMFQYGHAIDSGDEAGWLDCFIEDGIFDVRRRALAGGTVKPPARCAGRDQLAEFAEAHSRPPLSYHAHTMSSPKIALEGDSASVETKFVRVDADRQGAPYVASFGLYRDRFVPCPDGRWRIHERIAEVHGRGREPEPQS